MVHQGVVWLGHKSIFVKREDGTFLCPDCPRSFTYPPALQRHYAAEHEVSDPPSSPTKRPRGSFSPQQSKKCVRTHESSVAPETEDDDDDETVQGTRDEAACN
jgi:hypothetical protein